MSYLEIWFEIIGTMTTDHETILDLAWSYIAPNASIAAVNPKTSPNQMLKA